MYLLSRQDIHIHSYFDKIGLARLQKLSLQRLRAGSKNDPVVKRLYRGLQNLSGGFNSRPGLTIYLPSSSMYVTFPSVFLPNNLQIRASNVGIKVTKSKDLPLTNLLKGNTLLKSEISFEP